MQHREDLKDLGDMPFGRYPLWMIIQYQNVDRDLVVEHLLNYKRKNPDWFGTDLVAVFHIFCRPLLTQPKLIRFYADEDKWADYLAARVPEFAQYAK